jgi:hypothetical protein
MLTVCHKLPSGEDTIYQTETANFVPAAPEPCGRPPSLWIETRDARFELITGMAYVMNDAGRTVAKYDLGGLPGPHGDRP